ncbi:hypothetical protein [Pseudobacteriovorax antillogorgiicola]|nr:hypothetical protein [Pseudobacteriovorax antillogorgiicola]
MSSLFGGTVLRYAVTVGLYIASMGFGVVVFELNKTKLDLVSSFINLEMTLAILGACFPFAMIVLTSSLSTVAFGALASVSLCHIFVIIIGFLSGIELPLLMEAGEKASVSSGSQVLAFDYLGTVAGCFTFPLFLLPSLGLFATALSLALANALIAFIFAWQQSYSRTRSAMLLTTIMGLLIFSDTISEYILKEFYL